MNYLRKPPLNEVKERRGNFPKKSALDFGPPGSDVEFHCASLATSLGHLKGDEPEL
jgi:hypothetical protein